MAYLRNLSGRNEGIRDNIGGDSRGRKHDSLDSSAGIASRLRVGQPRNRGSIPDSETRYLFSAQGSKCLRSPPTQLSIGTGDKEAAA